MKIYNVFLLGVFWLASIIGQPELPSRHIVLDDQNFVSLVGPVTQYSVDAVIMDWNSPPIQEAMMKTNRILFYIDSPGGSVHAGNHLIQYMRSLQNQNITVECIGQNFMSMGFIIFQACNHRMILDNSIGMQHQMSFGMEGNIENMRSSFQLHDRINNDLIDMELEKIGLEKDIYLQKILMDWWLYGKENLEQNTADERIVYSCSPSIMNVKVQRKESFYGTPFQIKRHQCPLYKEIVVTRKEFMDFYDTANFWKLAKTINFLH